MTRIVHDVDMKEAKSAQPPDALHTYGASTCMAVGIVDRTTGTGYLGHFTAWDCGAESLLDQAVRDARHPGDLEIAVAGNTPLSRERLGLPDHYFTQALASTRAHGDWVLDMIASKSVPAERVSVYLEKQPGDDSYEMTVDTATRTITVRKEVTTLPASETFKNTPPSSQCHG